MPTLSVIIPNYMHARFLDQRIRSVVEQSFHDIEIILLDDCSTDDSRTIMQEWQKKDERIQLYFNRINSGSPFAQWNKGVRLAKGEFVWIAESDDFCRPDFVEKTLPLLQKNSDLCLAFAQSILVDENGRKINSFQKNYRFLYKTDRWESDFVASGADECTSYLLKNNTIPNASAIIFRKEHYLKAGGANPKFRLNGDWELYARILAEHSFAFVAEELNFFRTHQNTQRQRARRDAHAYPEMLAIQDFILSRFPESEKAFREARIQVSEWWVGSLPHQRWRNKDFLSVNLKLYRTFKKYRPFLFFRILYHILYASCWYILYKSGTLSFFKNIRNRLFPGKYFEH